MNVVLERLGETTSFSVALFLSTLCLFAAAFHNAACIVNPQDLAPKHSGSIFGIMNAAGAVPGNLRGHIQLS